MVDYSQGTGAAGVMRIRDNGGSVEFWIYTSSGSTWTGGSPWRYATPHGVSGWGTWSYAQGEGWKMLGAVNVSASGNVTFEIGDTGTAGFGGPTSFTVWVNRSTRPGTVAAPSFTSVGPTSLVVSWPAVSDGGSPIDGYLLRYWPNAFAAGPYTDHSFQNNRSRSVFGLTPGRAYTFVVFAHNGSPDNSGYSNQSAKSVITMPGLVRVKVNGVWETAIPYVKANGEWNPAEPYVKANGIWNKTG